MGISASGPAPCTQPTTSKEEYRLPWAVTQAEQFEVEDCPFCSLRRSHCAWLRTEIKRLSSEVASLQTTIPSKFVPDLRRRLQEPLPFSTYTGGVDDVQGQACTKCEDKREEVQTLQNEARSLDVQCKARIDFHERFARHIEALLIEKRHIEAQLFFNRRRGDDDSQELDGQFCAITRVNEPDEDAHALNWHDRNCQSRIHENFSLQPVVSTKL